MELKIRHLDKLLNLGIPKDKFTLIQSAIFPIMGLRLNGDLDFILESSLIPIYREKILKIKGLNIKINNENYKQFGCLGDDDLIKNLRKRGVETMIHYPIPPHNQLAYKDIDIKNRDLPISEKIHREVISLPMTPGMHIDTVGAVIDAIKDCLS